MRRKPRRRSTEEGVNRKLRRLATELKTMKTRRRFSAAQVRQQQRMKAAAKVCKGGSGRSYRACMAKELARKR